MRKKNLSVQGAKTISLLILMMSFALLPFGNAQASEMSEKLRGRILLQVEASGEGWYVNPDTERRCYLGTPEAAFRIMRELGLGISNSDFNRYYNRPTANLVGKILIKVEDVGKAYYVNPVNNRFYYLGRPADAFNVMRSLGLGITNANLEQIRESETYPNVQYTYRVIEVDDSSATPSMINIKKGSRLDITFKVKNTNVSRGGLMFKGSASTGDIPEIKAGESYSVSVLPVSSYSYIPFYPNSNIKLSYSIDVNLVE